MKLNFIALALSMVILLAFSACAKTDVVALTAIKSFDALLQVDSSNVEVKDDRYVLTSPTGKEFFSYGEKIQMSFELAPFIAAGLNPTMLGDIILVEGESLVVSVENKGYTKEATASKAFDMLVKNNRDAIGYHEALGHYGISFGNGNAFEWAKDLTQNDKDIVFVLNPEPFIQAGVDVENINGWIFAKVEMLEKNKKIQVDKLLKPYNL